jgi:hypothetical protein
MRKSLLRPLIGVVVLAPFMFWASGRVANLWEVAVLCFVTVIAYFGITVAIGTYDERDRAAARSLLRRGTPDAPA